MNPSGGWGGARPKTGVVSVKTNTKRDKDVELGWSLGRKSYGEDQSAGSSAANPFSMIVNDVKDKTSTDQQNPFSMIVVDNISISNHDNDPLVFDKNDSHETCPLDDSEKFNEFTNSNVNIADDQILKDSELAKALQESEVESYCGTEKSLATEENRRKPTRERKPKKWKQYKGLQLGPESHREVQQSVPRNATYSRKDERQTRKNVHFHQPNISQKSQALDREVPKVSPQQIGRNAGPEKIVQRTHRPELPTSTPPAINEADADYDSGEDVQARDTADDVIDEEEEIKQAVLKPTKEEERRKAIKQKAQDNKQESKENYERMKENHKHFFWKKSLQKEEISVNEVKNLLGYATQADIDDSQLRHQFILVLMKTKFLEMNGPIAGFLLQLITGKLPGSGNIEDIEKIYGAILLSILSLIDEIIIRIPHYGSTISTTTAIRALISRIPDIERCRMTSELLNNIDGSLQDPSLLMKSVNDPTQNWSSDLAFIGEPLVPPINELVSAGLPKKFVNLIDRPFGDCRKYIEIWYRLMREDFVSPLRTAIKQFKSLPAQNKSTCTRVDDAFLYTFSQVLECRIDKECKIFCLDFKQYNKDKLSRIDWTLTDRLRDGSFIVLSEDNFKTAIYAVIHRTNDDNKSRGYVWVRLVDHEVLPYEKKFQGLEPKTFWEPYRCVLERLRNQAANIECGASLPMEKYIVHLNCNSEYPAYLTSGTKMRTRGNDVIKVGARDAMSVLDLDQSQERALELALSHQMVVIQGPPGTGKSYVGAHLVDLLLHNKNLWQYYDSGCILLMSYTNHAIDQFVEECEKMGMNMDRTIRIGGRAKESMEKFSTRARWQEMREMHEYARLSWDTTQVHRQIAQLRNIIREAEKTISSDWLGIPFEAYSMFISTTCIHEFVNENGAMEHQHIVDWLTDHNSVQSDFNNITPMTYHQASRVSRVFILGFRDRAQLFAYWCESAKEAAQDLLLYTTNWLNQMVRRLQDKRKQEELATVRRAEIIAMTTTGASKHAHLLDAVQPTIVVVEEAAEVLESHIVSPLTAGCEHLILIGDHQQLRPNIAEYRLQRENRNLDISLFERLIMNNVPNRCLEVQHRMHPDIASVLVPHIYPSLKHHPSVHLYPPVRGVVNRLAFIHHTETESQMTEKSSYMNHFEAEYLVALCQYLLQQGYSPNDITILATYAGQSRLIRSLLRTGAGEIYDEVEAEAEADDEVDEDVENRSDVSDDPATRLFKQSSLRAVHVTTVDNYQGEENKIILLSFVRSNDQNKIGFLKWSNRICVALSRAKHGFYAIGNFVLFTTQSEIWDKLCNKLTSESPDSFSSALELWCERHQTTFQAPDAESFSIMAPEGGCTLKCDDRLKCGHACGRFCHPDDRDHVAYECMRPCTGELDCGHACDRPCSTLGDDRSFSIMEKFDGKLRRCTKCSKMAVCKNIVNVTPKCKHEGETTCSERGNYECHAQTTKTLDCNHTTTADCSIQKFNIKCKQIETHTLPCNHAVKRKCFMKNYPCPELVDRTLGCKHTVKAECGKTDDDISCNTTVVVKLKCLHTITVPCHRSTRAICTQQVQVIRSCQHPKLVQCGQEDDVERIPCTEMRQIFFDCENNHSIRQPCNEPIPENCTKYVSIQRKCGHYVSCRCVDETLELQKNCLVQTRSYRPCGHYQTVQCFRNNGKPPKGMCRRNCTFECSHGTRCSHHKCSDPCKPCTRPCKIRCMHSVCNKLCHEECDREPCNAKCTRDLKCKHKCQGICGEICPKYCRICLKLREVTYDTPRIAVKPCNHYFELAVMDEHMRTEENDAVQVVELKYCLKENCSALITYCPRYGNRIKRYLKLLKRRGFRPEQTNYSGNIVRWLYCKRGGHIFKSNAEDPLPERHDCYETDEVDNEDEEEDDEDMANEDEQVRTEGNMDEGFRLEKEDWAVRPPEYLRANPFFQKMARKLFL